MMSCLRPPTTAPLKLSLALAHSKTTQPLDVFKCVVALP